MVVMVDVVMVEVVVMVDVVVVNVVVMVEVVMVDVVVMMGGMIPSLMTQLTEGLGCDVYIEATGAGSSVK